MPDGLFAKNGYWVCSIRESLSIIDVAVEEENNMPKKTSREVLCWRISANGGIEFLPEAEDKKRHRLFYPEKYNYTWRDFAKEYPEDFQIMLDNYEPDEEQEETEETVEINGRLYNKNEVPSNIDERFDIEGVPGFADGDFPEWAATIMERYIPSDIIDEYGKVDDSVLNGDFIFFDPEKKDLIFEALKIAGIEVKDAISDQW